MATSDNAGTMAAGDEANDEAINKDASGDILMATSDNAGTMAAGDEANDVASTTTSPEDPVADVAAVVSPEDSTMTASDNAGTLAGEEANNDASTSATTMTDDPVADVAAVVSPEDSMMTASDNATTTSPEDPVADVAAVVSPEDSTTTASDNGDPAEPLVTTKPNPETKQQKTNQKKLQQAKFKINRMLKLAKATHVSYTEFDAKEFPRHQVEVKDLSKAAMTTLENQKLIIAKGNKMLAMLHKSEILAQLKQQSLTTNQRSDAEWALRNRRQLIFKEMVIQDHQDGIHELMVVTSTNTIVAKILISVTASVAELMETELEGMEPEDILQEASLFSGRFNDQFGKLGKYDTLKGLDATTFLSIGYLGELQGGKATWSVMDQQGCTVNVTDQWIEAAKEDGSEPIHQGFLEKVKAKQGTLVKFQTGASSGRRQVPPTSMYSPKRAADFPKIRYLNVKNDCCAGALCSAIHALGHVSTAQELFTDGWNSCVAIQASNPKKSCIKEFLSMCHSRLGEIGLPRVPPGKAKKRNIFDPLDPTRRLRSLFLCKLRGKRGSLHHTVCFFGHYVFDANCIRALPINPLTLEYICGREGYGGILSYEEYCPNGNVSCIKILT